MIRNQCRSVCLRNKHKSTVLQYTRNKITSIWNHDIIKVLFWVSSGYLNAKVFLKLLLDRQIEGKIEKREDRQIEGKTGRS